MNPADNFKSPTFLDRIIRFCLEMKVVVFLMVLVVIGWGIMVAPFDEHDKQSLSICVDFVRSKLSPTGA